MKNNVWSDEKPIEPGWYWFRDKQLKRPDIVKVDYPEFIMPGYQWVKIEEPKEKEE